jgi:type I restriction enzyme S subunit
MKQKSKGTVTPKLRFPEFRKEPGWDAQPLDNVSLFVKKRIPLHQLNLDTYVSTENLAPDYGGVEQASKLPPNGSATEYKPDDILIANIRPYLKKVWRSNRAGGASNDVIVIRPKTILRKDYLPMVIANDAFINYVMKTAKGVKMPRGDIASMKEYIVHYPTPAEQQKIADCLSSLDGLIAAEGRKLAALLDHNRGLMQQLFPQPGQTQPRLRLPEFRDKGEWEFRELSDFITERNQYSTDKVPLFSLTIEDGVTPKTERYERSFLVNDETNAYKLMLPNDFAFNPMNLRFGAIGRHSGTEKVAVSKYYNIFSCDRTVDSRFCEIYFSSNGMITFYDNMAIGSLIEKRRVHFAAFLKFNIRFPCLPEQQRIADCLFSLDTRITAQAAKIESLKQHKLGLMQQLFPAPETI